MMQSEAARPFILCADDFAITAGVSRGILALVDAGRLTATSAMTNRPLWPQLARELDQPNHRLAVGLHLNLTLGRPVGPMPRLAPAGDLPGLAEVVRRALSGHLPFSEIEEEIGRQLDEFCTALGRPPHFIDGHQHIHVLPGVRSRLLAVLAKRAITKAWLRDPSDQPAAIFRRGVAPLKATLIALLSQGFAAAADRVGWVTNQGFSGIGHFDAARDFGADFARFLVAPGRRHLVMCHPGWADDELRSLDSVAESREQELAFFTSARFPDVCAAANMRPAQSWSPEE